MLYLIKSREYLKIGFTNNLENRENSYHTENPDFEFISTREGNRQDESYLHNLLSSKIHHREWMLYDEFIIELFNNIQLPSEMEKENIIKKLKDDNNSLKCYITNLEIKNRNLEQEYLNHEDRINSNTEQIRQMEEKLRKQDENNEEIKEELRKWKEEDKQKNKLIESLQRELNNLKNQTKPNPYII